MNTAILKKTYRPTIAWIHLPTLDSLAVGYENPRDRLSVLSACCVTEGRTGARLSSLLAARTTDGWLYGTTPLLRASESHRNKRARTAAITAKKWLAATINERWPGSATGHEPSHTLVTRAAEARFIAPDGPTYGPAWNREAAHSRALVDIEVRNIILRSMGHPGLRDSTVKAIVDLALA
jgi:hypothetical protein